ncbi:MAG: hypothetical protein WBL28_05470 [Methylotenera sp.]
MNRACLPILLALSVSACASNTQLAKIDPDKWTELTCSGFLTWNDCRQQARAICPRGFYTADYYENYLIQRRVVSVACKT